MALIVIDPGHGGSDPGKVGLGGLKEKDIALDIGQRVADILNPNHRAEITRRDDTFLELEERPATAARLRADVFVSIHFNSDGSNSSATQGTETYQHPNASSESQQLARAVQGRVVAATGYRDRGVKEANLVVIRPDLHFTETSACLVEVSFLSNPDEEIRLQDVTYRQNIAQSIADGIYDFLTEEKFPILSSSNDSSVNHTFSINSLSHGAMSMSSRARLFGQFQWPAGIAILYVIFKACQFKSINEKVGILEEAWNFFLENFVVVFLAVAPTLFLITMLEALISPILMGFWNRRLSSKVKLLQDNGDNDLARSLAGRAMTWPVLLRAYLVFLGVGLTFSLIGYVVQQTTTARATATVPANAVAPATKALASNSASGVKANDDQANDDQANDDQPGGVKAGDDQAGDDQAGDAKAGREGTRVEIFPLPGSGNLNALFLWSFSIVGVFFLIDWFTSFISFMFGFENRDVAYLEEVRKN